MRSRTTKTDGFALPFGGRSSRPMVIVFGDGGLNDENWQRDLVGVIVLLVMVLA